MANLHLTAAEQYRMFGTVTGEELERLLDIEQHADEIGGVDAHLQEAQGQYPEEDFLCAELEELRQFAKGMRNPRKQELLDLVARMADRLQQQVHSSEYGEDELKKALRLLRGAA